MSTAAPPLVLHLVYRFDVGGLENGVVNLINHMPAGRFRHAVVALTDCSAGFCRRIARADVEFLFHPAGYNIGINDGAAAGQTVPHLHIHLIPRYAGDRDDPRGGVRWVLPDKAAYWEKD